MSSYSVSFFVNFFNEFTNESIYTSQNSAMCGKSRPRESSSELRYAITKCHVIPKRDDKSKVLL